MAGKGDALAGLRANCVLIDNGAFGYFFGLDCGGRRLSLSGRKTQPFWRNPVISNLP